MLVWKNSYLSEAYKPFSLQFINALTFYQQNYFYLVDIISKITHFRKVVVRKTLFRFDEFKKEKEVEKHLIFMRHELYYGNWNNWVHVSA